MDQTVSCTWAWLLVAVLVLVAIAITRLPMFLATVRRFPAATEQRR